MTIASAPSPLSVNLDDEVPFQIQSLGSCEFWSPFEVEFFNDETDCLMYKPFFSTKELFKAMEQPPPRLMNQSLLQVPTSTSKFNHHPHHENNQPKTYPQAFPGHCTKNPLFMEKAGPRQKLFFNPQEVVAGIVTCGGLCPGLNNVIRSLVQCLHYNYKVKRVLGFKYGYEGLNSKVGVPPIELTTTVVKDIHRFGGCILGSSRGPQDVKVMVNTLLEYGVNMLFTIGGDGTQKGAHAIATEIQLRNLAISIIGIPKTIDNDIAYCCKTFGFDTAVSMALDSISSAHEEARASRGGIGIVKLMGRDSGFIALYSALASGEANLVLLPEVPFTLDTIYKLVEKRLKENGHILIVVAEGAGQDLAVKKQMERDASGNVKLADIGLFLKDNIAHYCKSMALNFSIKYIDPSYTIRGCPAISTDAIFTVSLAHQAVHAAMAGKTDCIIGLVHDEFVHIPVKKAVEYRKKVDVNSILYQTLLHNTGMPLKLT